MKKQNFEDKQIEGGKTEEDLKKENYIKEYKKEDENMPYKYVRRWIPGKYVCRNGKRVHIRGHYKTIKIYVPPRSPTYRKRIRR